MTADAVRTDPVIGIGERMLLLQESTLANRLSDLATVAAAFFRAVAAGTAPDRLVAQRRRTDEFAMYVSKLVSEDRELLVEYSELIPSKVLSSGAAQISAVPADLATKLRALLDAIEDGSADRELLAEEARSMRALAEAFQKDGRQQLLTVTDKATY